MEKKGFLTAVKKYVKSVLDKLAERKVDESTVAAFKS